VVDEVGEGFAGELVNDVQDLDDPSGGGDVELVVQGPHVIRILGSEPPGGCRRVTEALTFAASGRDPQPLFSPQTLDLFAVHDVAFAAQHGVRPPVAPTGMTLGEAAQPRPQLPVRVRLGRLVTLGRAVLAHDPARPSLRDPEPLA
jgi:hypothetical protein